MRPDRSTCPLLSSGKDGHEMMPGPGLSGLVGCIKKRLHLLSLAHRGPLSVWENRQVTTNEWPDHPPVEHLETHLQWLCLFCLGRWFPSTSTTQARVPLFFPAGRWRRLPGAPRKRALETWRVSHERASRSEGSGRSVKVSSMPDLTSSPLLCLATVSAG